MEIKDIFGKTITVTDLDAAIEQLQDFDKVPCPFKMNGTDTTVGEYHADALRKLLTIRDEQHRANGQPPTGTTEI